ncbi:uncharacterized protein LOC111637253 isoform X4 [Centruroides sculpturatus]|uniref:uncharacterized protein LOC111637253 isoform X3 n=1 Tax=Centruroides sculpturatus TaxID=218467 RepID=UPI000C6E81C6|nr:uncharacterized protein LOC111637253 isoform X3 [Centruroides sculpturatus]XP_023238468.1 uncharacterized protein LOC111637253 isoform X4 [Centruroides sculpturatus]
MTMDSQEPCFSGAITMDMQEPCFSGTLSGLQNDETDNSNIDEIVSVTPEEEGNGNNSSARNNDVEASIEDAVERLNDDKKKSRMGRCINGVHRWYYYILAFISFLIYFLIVPFAKIITGARCLGELEGDNRLPSLLIAGGVLMIVRTILDIIIETKVIESHSVLRSLAVLFRTIFTTILVTFYVYVRRSVETFPSGPPHCEIIRDMFSFSPITDGLRLVCFNLCYNNIFYKFFPWLFVRVSKWFRERLRYCNNPQEQSDSTSLPLSQPQEQSASTSLPLSQPQEQSASTSRSLSQPEAESASTSHPLNQPEAESASTSLPPIQLEEQSASTSRSPSQPRTKNTSTRRFLLETRL